MHHVLILGAGKIGSLIAFLLAHSNDYHIYLGDIHDVNPYAERLQGLSNCQYVKLDASQPHLIATFLKGHAVQIIISSLPYYCNIPIAQLAAEHHLHYFDLTEDVKTTETVQALSKHTEKAFVPQCGLAPGFISIVANDLMRHFPQLDTVKMRVGALPNNTSNALQYSLTWS